MSENKNKLVILLLGIGIALAAAAVALAAFLFGKQEPAAPVPIARPASSPASSPAPGTSASASATVASAPASQESAASTAASMAASARGASQSEAVAAAPVAPPVAPEPPAIKRDQTIDCLNPTRNHERLICSDDELLELDAKLAAAYRRSRAHSGDPDYVRDAQRAWERDVRNRCETDTCLVKAYKRRIAVVADPLN